MSENTTTPAALLKAVDGALRLLEGRNLSEQKRTDEPLPSLYEQCLALRDQIQERQDPPVRIVHHFACTGGTLISKHLMAMPNVRFLSEMDPLSTLGANSFAPSDLIQQMRNSNRLVQDDLLVRIFISGLHTVYDACRDKGERLVIRDHTHSHFCTETDFTSRPTVAQMVMKDFNTKMVVTVRHPLDSYLSLRENGWVHFTPGTLNEYARRYLAFLTAHKQQKIIKYEDFVANPLDVLEQICDVLELAFYPDIDGLVDGFSASGDSGRSGSEIAPRTRRPIAPVVQVERDSAQSYLELCQALDYDP